MYLMYVDESGDFGLTNSPTRYLVLTGLVMHETQWQPCLDRLIAFRQRLTARFGLRLREEIHAGAMINKPGPLVRIARNDRLTILREFADELAGMPDGLRFINVLVDKQEKMDGYDVFEMAWKTLIQRFENTLIHGNFPGPSIPNQRGLILPDHTDDKKLTGLLRAMRRYNPVPHQAMLGQAGYRNLALNAIVEDPNFRDSRDSYFIQAADLAAFLLYQHVAPSTFMRKKSGHNYFSRLDPVLCKVASSTDPRGIVRL